MTRHLKSLIVLTALLFLSIFAASDSYASEINWTTEETSSIVSVVLHLADAGGVSSSETLGIDSSYAYDNGDITFSNTAGHNGVRSLRAYSDLSYNTGYFDYDFMYLSNSVAAQQYSFSLDHAAPINLSYSLGGYVERSNVISEDYFLGSEIEAYFYIIRSRPDDAESVLNYRFYSWYADRQTQSFSDEGSIMFEYDPSWVYRIKMVTNVNTYTESYPPEMPEDMNVEDRHIRAEVDHFTVNLSVAPEPVSSILFIAGGALLAGRRYFAGKI